MSVLPAIPYAKVLQETTAFQGATRTSEYMLQGINVWPYLRTNTAWRRLNELTPLREKRGMGEAKNRLLRYSRLVLSDRAKNTKPSAAQVVFVTLTNRRESVGGKFWHTLADPLAMEFERAGVSTLVCEGGQARSPRARPSLRISRKFKLMRVLGRIGPRITEPGWFAPYAKWASDFLGRPVTWQMWEEPLREMFARAEVFTEMFRKLGTKAVFVDCWYSPESLAATLAAKRLGLLSVELQHGLQGAHMNGYAGWTDEYDLIPDVFWVWGQHAADALHERNTFGKRAIVGGNCWLNAWRGPNRPPELEIEVERATQLRHGSKCVVLVTHQQGVDYEPVFKAIEQSPRDWCWLIRIHRKMRNSDTYAQLKSRLSGIHPNVDIDASTDLPLYPLMTAIDVHVTAFSTCAIEALAFGKPTVAINENAKAAFGELLNGPAMRYAQSPDEIIHGIESFGSFDPAEALRLAEAHYADSSATDIAIQDVLGRARLSEHSRQTA